MHTVREVLTPCLREIFVGMKSEPDIRSSRCLVTSFFQHLSPSPDLTSAFGGQRSIQLSYRCVEPSCKRSWPTVQSLARTPFQLLPFERLCKIPSDNPKAFEKDVART